MYFFSVNANLPFRNAVFGVWPMARNTPATGCRRSGSPTVLCEPHAGHAVACRCPTLRRACGSRGFRSWGWPAARSDHDLRRPQLVAAMDQVDRAGELAEVVGLFDGRIAAADHGQRLVAESRQGPVADRAAADAAVLVLLLRRQAEVVRPGAGGHDHRLRLVALAVGGGQAEGPWRRNRRPRRPR